MKKLSHIDEENRPAMVDVSDKQATLRTARAVAIVEFPDDVAARFADGDIRTKKGPVFATAIIAGVMAAKKTHDIIPFCHPLGLSGCDIDIGMQGNRAVIHCECRVHHKTGVEMEALTGASIAALTIYDMCKALTHDITIRETRLLSKTGGKQDVHRD